MTVPRRVLKLVAGVLSALVVAIGVYGLAAPDALVALGRAMQSEAALWWIAALRIVFGAALWAAAATSRWPRTLGAIGVVLIVAGAATPLIGVERARWMLDIWAAQGPLFIRSWSLVALAFGAFVLRAITGPASRAGEPSPP